MDKCTSMYKYTHTHTHTHTHTQSFYGSLDFAGRDNWVSWYRNKRSLTPTYRGHQSSLICFLHLLWSMASSLFSICAWQSFSTISFQVFFGLPLGLAPPLPLDGFQTLLFSLLV